MNMNEDAKTTRRNFLKATSTAAVATPLILSASAYAAPSDTIRVGLVGCGGRGSGAANQAMNADPNLAFTAIGDVFEEKLQNCLGNLKKAHGDKVKVTPATSFVGLDAFEKVLKNVDVVLLATPPGFRPQHFKAAIEAEKHVFLEKPMATDVPGVRSVMATAEAAKAKNLAVVAGFCWRYDAPRREFYKRIHEGAIGDIRAIYATYLTGPVKSMPPAETRPAGMSDVEWQLRNWYNFTWLSGDGLVEQACHSIDKIAWAMKDISPLSCTATGGRQIPNNEGNIFDHIDVVYEYPNNVKAFMGQRQIANCYNDNSDYVMGALGTATIGRTRLTIKNQEEWNYNGPKGDMYQQEHNELFASIRAGKVINDGGRMCQSTLMAIMGRTAAYTGQQITWEQILKSEKKYVPDNLTWDMKLPIEPMAIPGKTKFV